MQAPTRAARESSRAPQAQERRALRGAVRNLFVAAVSAGVVAFLVLYALSRPGVELNAAAGPVVRYPGSGAVVHGRVVEADGDGVGGAQLVVWRPGRAARTARSGKRGFFRLDVRGRCATYQIALAVPAEGRGAKARLAHRLCPGEALEVDARLVATGNFVWAPTR